MKRDIFLLILSGVLHFGAIGLDLNLLQFEGLVIDSETERVIPFAQITFGQTGTVSNIEGHFILKISDISVSSKLIVSSLGYQSIFLNIEDLKKKQYTIRLNPYAGRKESLSNFSGKKIIKDLINHRQINYEYDDLLLTTYYKETIHAGDEVCYLAEGILDIYLPTIYSKNKPAIEVMKSRKKEYVSLDSIKAPIINGHARDMLEGSMRRERSFLEHDEIDNYKFSVVGVSRFQDKEVVKVSFEPANDKGIAKGVLYVDGASHALVKTVYYPVVSNQKFWTEVKWIEEYTEVDGSWYLKYAYYSGKWEEGSQIYAFNALLLVTEFEQVDQPPQMNNTLEDNAVFFDEAVETSDLFWEDYNFLKLTEKEQQTSYTQ